MKEIAKEVAKIKTQCGLKVASIKEEKDALQALHVNLKEAEEGLAQEKGKSEKLSVDCDTSVKSYEEKLEFIKNTESLVQTLTTGMGSSEGQENGYMDQLKHAKQEASSISSEIQQLKFKLSHMVKELKIEEPKAKAARKENESISKEFESRKNIISMIKEELTSMSYDPSLEGPLLDRKSSLENSLKKLQKVFSVTLFRAKSLTFIRKFMILKDLSMEWNSNILILSHISTEAKLKVLLQL